MAKVNHGPNASFSVKGAQKRTKADFIKKHSKNITFKGMSDEVIATKLGAIWDEAQSQKTPAAKAEPGPSKQGKPQRPVQTPPPTQTQD